MADMRALTVPVRITRTEAVVICDIGNENGLMVGYFRDETPWTNAKPWTADDDATGWSGEEGG